MADTFVIKIDKEMKKMIEDTKKEFSMNWKIDPTKISTPTITPQIVHWAKIGKEVDKKKKKRDIASDIMDSITGVK